MGGGTRTPFLVAMGALAAACSSARPAPRATVASAAPAEDPAMTSASPSPAPSPAAIREPLPDGYRRISGQRMSFGVPSTWVDLPIDRPRVIAAASNSAPTERVMVATVENPYEGTLDEYHQMTLAQIASDQGVVTDDRRVRFGNGDAFALDLVKHTQTSLRMHVFVMETRSVGLYCGCGSDTASAPTMDTFCDAVFSSLRLGSTPGSAASGFRRVSGENWSVQLPSTWGEISSGVVGVRTWQSVSGDRAVVVTSAHLPETEPYTLRVLRQTAADARNHVISRRDARYGPNTGVWLDLDRTDSIVRQHLLERMFSSGDVVVDVSCGTNREFRSGEADLCNRILATAQPM